MRPTPSWNHASASPESWATRARSGASESATAIAPGRPCSSATTNALERNVAMLARRVAVALGLQRGEGGDQPGAGVARVDDVVEVAPRGRLVGMRELLAILVDLRLGRFALVEDFDRALGAHDGDLRGGPGDVVVPADVLRVHHVVRAAVRLARDHRELGDGRLAVGVQQLGAVLDDAAVLLRHTREEPRHVFECHQWNVERVAEADEAGALDRG